MQEALKATPRQFCTWAARLIQIETCPTSCPMLQEHRRHPNHRTWPLRVGGAPDSDHGDSFTALSHQTCIARPPDPVGFIVRITQTRFQLSLSLIDRLLFLEHGIADQFTNPNQRSRRRRVGAEVQIALPERYAATAREASVRSSHVTIDKSGHSDVTEGGADGRKSQIDYVESHPRVNTFCSLILA